MKSKALYRNILIASLFLISFIWFAYIGRYKTIYGAGILLSPVVLVLALLPFFTSAFLFHKSWAFSGRVYLISCALLFSVLIASYYIDNYKPTIYVHIPEDYDGCVFLFHVETESLEDVYVNPHGVAYIPYGGHYQIKVKIGDKKRPDVLNSGNYNQISFYNADSSKIHWVDVSCWAINPQKRYSHYEYVPREYYPCMEGRELRMLMELNQVDSSIIKWHFYNYVSDSHYEP